MRKQKVSMVTTQIQTENSQREVINRGEAVERVLNPPV
jgi:hypothetical protein